MNEALRPADDIGKQRIEALSDGLCAIALTLLVLELKLPPVGEAATNADVLHALRELMPKVFTWFLSFWVMAVLWLSQVRVYRMVHSLSRTLKMRAYALPVLAATAFVLGFFVPGRNMLAMLPMVFIRSHAHAHA